MTYKVESDESTGLREIIIIESKDKTKVPTAHIMTEDGELIRTYNLPVGGHVVVEDGQKVKAGEVIVKIPRAVGKAGDITGGLPRVTELFEARNPSNPAVVSEIDGEVTMGKVKRGNREIIVTSKTGEVKKYLVPLSKQILVQENDYVRAGTPLSDGAITPADILAIKGPTAVQEYIVNEVQDVYRLQGVKINDKHFEIIVRQMMRKVEIDEPGDTRFLEQQVVDKMEFMEENDRIWGKKVVVDAGDSQSLQAGQIVTARKLRDENSMLKTPRLETRGSARRCTCDFYSDSSRYHPCCIADFKLHVGCFLPGNDEGTERGCHQRKGGPSGRYEGERNLRSPDSCRYRTTRVREDYRWLQRRVRPYACQQEDGT